MGDLHDMLIAFARPVRHEANNLLAALSGTAEIMLRSPASTPRDIARAERLRDSRVAAQNRATPGRVTVADLETLRAQDITAAVLDACAEKHVPVRI